MAAQSSFLGNSLVKKYWMALTGLFLCLFLVIHLVGNLSLIWGTGEAFNEYTVFMTSFPPVKIVSYLLYFSILFHAVDGILILTMENKKARPVDYAYSKPEKNSIWASRNMGVLGTAVLVFIVLHMYQFWAAYKFTELPADANGLPDIYSIVVESFQNPLYVGLYVLSMVAIGFHLYHGFASAFQTMGLNHPRYNGLIEKTGKAYAIIVPTLFAIIPIYMLLSK